MTRSNRFLSSHPRSFLLVLGDTPFDETEVFDDGVDVGHHAQQTEFPATGGDDVLVARHDVSVEIGTVGASVVE